MTTDGVLKLGDFGVARVLANSGELALTRVGTPCNVSPERCEGKPYSFESDVWALGCVLFELLTLRPAFRAETIPLLTEKILAGAYAEVSEADAVPPEVLAIVDSALTVAPEQRPSIQQLLAAPILAAHAARHEAADREAAGTGQVRRDSRGHVTLASRARLPRKRRSP